jgi:hypothetical protein
MQSPVLPDSPTPSSFAGFLAAITQPDRNDGDRAAGKTATKTQVWNDELLAEDVATLSYEQALRVHSRYHADEPTALAAEAASVEVTERPVPQLDPLPEVLTNPAKLLKDASITIRLSRDEDSQLRKRSAEAGLSVSAYIRSCTFEAESLRTLVKDTLSQLRTADQPPTQEANSRNRPRRWSRLLWPGRRSAPGVGPNQA